MPSEVVDLFTELAALPSPPGEERAVADAVTRYLRDLDAMLARFIRAQLLFAVLGLVAYTAFLLLAQFPYAFALGARCTVIVKVAVWPRVTVLGSIRASIFGTAASKALEPVDELESSKGSSGGSA